MNLHLRRRARRRLPKRVRVPLYVPELPDVVWSADFMSDALYARKRFRTFNVIDDYNREALTIEVDTSLRGERLVRRARSAEIDHHATNMLKTNELYLKLTPMCNGGVQAHR